MKKTLLKRLFKYFKICVLITLIGVCNQVSLMKAESKTINENLNKTLDLHAMSVKLEEFIQSDLYTPLDTYNGTLTGYAADCPLCGGTLGCTGQNVLTDRITTFQDNDYGEVRIVASSRSLPCGSIVKFSLSSISSEPITAIVLDRGVTGTSLDLLVESEESALSQVGRRSISYDILRVGYQR